MSLVIAYIVALGTILVLDAFWILVLAKNFYAEKIGFLFQESFNIVPAAFFYPIYSLAIVFLAVLPALSGAVWTEALWRGALLGLAAYAAYDLTNHATIAKWPLSVTLVDISWGIFVTATASVVAYFVINYLK